MRLILIIAITFFALNAFGQINNLKMPQVSGLTDQTKTQNDTTIKVTYNNNDLERSLAFYLNGQFVPEAILKTINSDFIENIRVEKQDTEVGTQKYYGQIFITTKGDYRPKLISLSDLKLKYTNLRKASTIFMIDNEIIYNNYDRYMVDENFILKISIEKVENKEERLKYNLVKIFTKTEENIRKSKEIRIRGIQSSLTELEIK
jgi:hypothetical protein